LSHLTRTAGRLSCSLTLPLGSFPYSDRGLAHHRRRWIRIGKINEDRSKLNFKWVNIRVALIFLTNRLVALFKPSTRLTVDLPATII
jgi:hypothetical protein